MLPQTDTPRLPARQTGRDQRDGHDDEPGQARGHVVHHVVQPRAAPSESQVLRRLVTHHRIHGADDLEQHEPRQAREHIPEHGAHETVGEVLAEALDRGATARGAVHAIRVAADECAHGEARAGHVIAPHGRFDPPHVVQEIAKREQRVDNEHVHQPGRARRDRKRERHDRCKCRQPQDDEQNEEQDSTAVAVGAGCTQPRFEPLQRPARRAVRGAPDKPGHPGSDRSRRRPPGPPARARAIARAQSPARHFSDHPRATALRTRAFTSPVAYVRRRERNSGQRCACAARFAASSAACCAIASSATDAGSVP